MKKQKEYHKDSNTRLYNIWKGMKSRCNSKTVNSKVHGQRGISVCDTWKNSYVEFKTWALANGYTDKRSIDRINNNGNYEPSNCRWTTQEIQSANTRKLYKHNKSGYRGVSWNKQYGKWEVSISISNKTVKIGYYDDVKQAAKAYDTYIIENKLPHTVNNMLCNNEKVESNTGKLLLSNNKSGYVGVSFVQRLKNTKKPWFTSICENSKTNKQLYFSGYYSTALEAAKAREEFILKNKDKIKYLNKLKLNSV